MCRNVSQHHGAQKPTHAGNPWRMYCRQAGGQAGTHARTHHDEVERPLLVVRADGEEGAVVLVEEELEGGHVLEGPDLVLAVQHLGVGLEQFRLLDGTSRSNGEAVQSSSLSPEKHARG